MKTKPFESPLLTALQSRLTRVDADSARSQAGRTLAVEVAALLKTPESRAFTKAIATGAPLDIKVEQVIGDHLPRNLRGVAVLPDLYATGDGWRKKVPSTGMIPTEVFRKLDTEDWAKLAANGTTAATVAAALKTTMSAAVATSFEQ